MTNSKNYGPCTLDTKFVPYVSMVFLYTSLLNHYPVMISDLNTLISYCCRGEQLGSLPTPFLTCNNKVSSVAIIQNLVSFLFSCVMLADYLLAAAVHYLSYYTSTVDKYHLITPTPNNSNLLLTQTFSDSPPGHFLLYPPHLNP